MVGPTLRLGNPNQAFISGWLSGRAPAPGKSGVACLLEKQKGFYVLFALGTKSSMEKLPLLDAGSYLRLTQKDHLGKHDKRKPQIRRRTAVGVG